MRGRYLCCLVWILIVAGIGIETKAVAAGNTNHWRTDFRAAEAEAKRDGKLLLLHFHARWCGPCRRMNREVLRSPQLAGLLGDHVIAVKVDFDQSQGIARRFGVQVLPSDVFVRPDGRVMRRTTGYQSADQYLAGVARVEAGFARARKAQQLAKSETSSRPQHKPAQNRETARNREQIASLNGSKKIAGDSRRFPAVPGDHPEAVMGLDEFCPVTLWFERKWVRGRAEYSWKHKGTTFYLAGAEELAKFKSDPARFAPRLLGCDPVVLMDSERAVPGSTQWGAFFEGELFLFQSANSRGRFRQSPERFSRTRHVLLEQIERKRL